jgi:phage terminase large subunit GpA-like protein
MRLLPKGEPHLLDIAVRVIAPRRSPTVSDWADANRIITSKQSSIPGPWRTARTPYLREIMDCMAPASRVHEITVMKASQIGVTDGVFINSIGFMMVEQPCPMMVFMPTLESMVAWKVQKLNPLLTETPAIRDLLGGQRSRDAAQRMEIIDFPGGTLFLASGNSPNSYAQKSARVVKLDDLDRFPDRVGEEGDVVGLARGRTKSFPHTYKLLKVSTPTVLGRSHIDREWQKSDKRRYYMPCPHCGQMQYLDWGGKEESHGIKWDRDLTEAWYLCQACHTIIPEHHKPKMLSLGQWLPEHPSIRERGYHLPGMLAAPGLGPSWLSMAREFIAARRSPLALRTFVNTALAEPFEEETNAVDPAGMLARREDYPTDTEEGKLPGLVSTVWADVQGDRLEYSHIRWGLGEEAWLIEHVIIAGDPDQPHVWAEYGRALDDIKPIAAGVDSGYKAESVYKFLRTRANCYATKGRDGAQRPIVQDEKQRAQAMRRQRKNKIAVPVHLIGADAAKSLLYSRLKIREAGEGYIHFPNNGDFDDEYFNQLTAERLRTKQRTKKDPFASGVHWVKIRDRNEALDCWVGCLAVLRLKNVDLKKVAQELAARVAKADKPRPAPAPASNGFAKEGWAL